MAGPDETTIRKAARAKRLGPPSMRVWIVGKDRRNFRIVVAVSHHRVKHLQLMGYETWEIGGESN